MKQKRLDKRISLWHLDQIPYGTAYAYENLPQIFPRAEIRTSSRFPDLTTGDDTIRALIIISTKFAADSDEMNDITQFAASGNQVFISALNFEDSVLSKLHLKWNIKTLPYTDSAELRLMNPLNFQWDAFSYPGYTVDSYFESADTAHMLVLGKDMQGNPDFIRIPFPQGGAVFIHLNPFAFSNFFLLHKENRSYYDQALSYMPAKTGVVEWSDYFRYDRKEKRFSALHFILSNRALRWAFWLTLVLFLILFLIDSKRKQRPLKEIPALQNASVDFVKTVGRLYFQQKNNQNLAAKMVAAFLEHIRSAYNLSTSVLNEEFISKLAFRSGRPVQEVGRLVQSIHDIRLNPELTDQALMSLHHQINQFNKPA